MQSRRHVSAAALAVASITVALSVLDLVVPSVRRWWGERSFTASVVSGILVLLVTVLIVDRVVLRRQLRDRSRAIAAQAAIVLGQAARATNAVVAGIKADGDRESASDELRTYMTMLLISAPMLIDAELSRNFLEQAQWLAGELASALATTRAAAPPDDLRDRLEGAVSRLRDASAPLLAILDPGQRLAVLVDQGRDDFASGWAQKATT